MNYLKNLKLNDHLLIELKHTFHADNLSKLLLKCKIFLHFLLHYYLFSKFLLFYLLMHLRFYHLLIELYNLHPIHVLLKLGINQNNLVLQFLISILLNDGHHFLIECLPPRKLNFHFLIDIYILPLQHVF